MIYTSCGPATYTFFKHSFCYFEGEHVDVLYTHELKLERELVQAYMIFKGDIPQTYFEQISKRNNLNIL